MNIHRRWLSDSHASIAERIYFGCSLCQVIHMFAICHVSHLFNSLDGRHKECSQIHTNSFYSDWIWFGKYANHNLDGNTRIHSDERTWFNDFFWAMNRKMQNNPFWDEFPKNSIFSLYRFGRWALLWWRKNIPKYFYSILVLFNGGDSKRLHFFLTIECSNKINCVSACYIIYYFANLRTLQFFSLENLIGTAHAVCTHCAYMVLKRRTFLCVGAKVQSSARFRSYAVRKAQCQKQYTCWWRRHDALVLYQPCWRGGHHDIWRISYEKFGPKTNGEKRIENRLDATNSDAQCRRHLHFHICTCDSPPAIDMTYIFILPSNDHVPCVFIGSIF